eukprot:EG_transcript_13145
MTVVGSIDQPGSPDAEGRVPSVLSVESLGTNVYKLEDPPSGFDAAPPEAPGTKLPPIPGGKGAKGRPSSLPLNPTPLSPMSRGEKSPRGTPKNKVVPTQFDDVSEAGDVPRMLSPKTSKRTLQKEAFQYTSGHALAAFHFPPISDVPPSLPVRLLSMFSLKRTT